MTNRSRRNFLSGAGGALAAIALAEPSLQGGNSDSGVAGSLSLTPADPRDSGAAQVAG